MRRVTHPLLVFSVLLISALPCAAQSQTITVGPDGDVADVTSALAAVLSAPTDSNWIKVQSGVTTTENLDFPPSWTSGTIWLSGGWDSAFATQSEDPSDTTISGGLSDVVITIQISGGTVIVSDLSIVDGSSAGGGGVEANLTGNANVRLDNLSIHDNVSISAGSGSGGGVKGSVEDSASLTIADCEIHTNVATGTASPRGGGVDVYATNTSSFLIESTSIHDNDLLSDVDASGAGVFLYLDATAVGELTDVHIDENTVSNVIPVSVDGTGLAANLFGGSQLSIHRSTITENTLDVVAAHDHVTLRTYGTSRVRLTDSVVAAGHSDGVFVRADDQSAITMTNLTVADHDDDGISVYRVPASSAVVNLSNTIAWGNSGLDLSVSSGPVAQTGNLIGVNPLFTDPANLDYRFRPASSARDAGDLLPPGGLGTTDIRGGIRVLGAVPDAGAFEGDADLLFSGGFEGSWIDHWSGVVGLTIS